MFQQMNEISGVGMLHSQTAAAPVTSSPLNSIHMAAEDVRTALGAAQNLMGRLIGYPQAGAATKVEPSGEPPLFDLLGNAGMSISSQAREILACINAINAKLP